MVSNYSERKKEVLDLYEKLEELVTDLPNYEKELDLPDLTERSKTLLSDIRGKAEKAKQDRFSIIVAGESKSGKSTFINAYLGEELLPMDIKQCTSSLIEIKYGETFSVRATYADGREEELKEAKKAREFLTKNAALADEYRSIPVITINSEILIK